MVVEYFVRNLHHYDFLKSRTEFGQAYNLIFVPQGRFSHATIELLIWNPLKKVQVGLHKSDSWIMFYYLKELCPILLLKMESISLMENCCF